jgi:phosphoribosylamine---glycine ligase
MKLLLIGGGGREHALAWKLVQSPQVTRLFVSPGNGGTAGLPRTENVPLDVANSAALIDFARSQQIDLTVVGPEAPLVAGIVDHFQAAGLRIFGPTGAAAQLEGSKAFTKAFLARHNIPTGGTAIFHDYATAMAHLAHLPLPPVVKASGLAAGKGVIVPETHAEAEAALAAILRDRRFGAAGETVLLEERLSGPELSVLAFCDGQTLRLLPAAQDHKRLLDGDRGPNTGGMGAFAPSPLATAELLAEVERTILQPTLAGMAAEGAPYVGVLYAGLMLTADGPKVLEFNCRLGDPETQVILPLLESDLMEVLVACVDGNLDTVTPRWRPASAVTVVMAAGGYPDDYVTGQPIHGLKAAEAAGCIVFHAGTRAIDQAIVTAGGRVLSVTAVEETIAAAAEQAYAGVQQIEFASAHYRRDIGQGIRTQLSAGAGDD